MNSRSLVFVLAAVQFLPLDFFLMHAKLFICLHVEKSRTHGYKKGMNDTLKWIYLQLIQCFAIAMFTSLMSFVCSNPGILRVGPVHLYL